MLNTKSSIISITLAISCSLTAAAQDEQGVTPLMRAVRDGQNDEVKKLLKQGVDLEARDSWGWTALIYAAVRGDERAVKALLDKGANVNAQSNQGLTPLMAAARSQRDKIVKLLIARGADIHARDKNGNTALSLSTRGGRNKTQELIEKAGATESPGGGPLEIDSSPGVSVRPIPLNRPRPNYTEDARRKKITGVVRVRALVGTDGQVKMVRITSELPAGLSEQAARAVFQMQFHPAMKDGHPVEFWTPVEIEFNLRERT
ncbi:MAG: TonB family protein [Acidobacteriota bacterium]